MRSKLWIHLLRTMNVCTKFHRSLSNAGGTIGKVRGSPKSLKLILWRWWISVQNFREIYSTVLQRYFNPEIQRFIHQNGGPTDRQTGIAIPRLVASKTKNVYITIGTDWKLCFFSQTFWTELADVFCRTLTWIKNLRENSVIIDIRNPICVYSICICGFEKVID